MRRYARFGALGIMAIVAACATPAPTPGTSVTEPGAPEAGQPVSATGQSDGVLVTIALSSGSVPGGAPVRLRVSALNVGLDDVTYMSGGCGATSGVEVGGGPGTAPGEPVGAPPPGSTPEDILALARWSALSGADAGPARIHDPNLPDDVGMACPANLDYARLAPGETIEGEWEWAARTGDTAPAPAGTYRFRYTFPFVGRGDVRPDAEGNMPAPAVQPTVTIPIEVTPGPTIAITAAEAVDRAIADPEVQAWAARRLARREDLTGGSVRLVDDRAWRFTIGLTAGEAQVDVDATTGEVVRRQLP
ncbi:MAG TPA: hypothetical protein VFY23_09280 [Candidatus Limnocylindrales bacterium]|nr:hypothetical protein [Candidatus Limnocylindrales bacterium]